MKSKVKISIGDKIYRLNRKTHKVGILNVIDVQYVLDNRIGSKRNFTESELQEMVDNGDISMNPDEIKNQAIKALEEQFNIKLKEV